MYNVLESLVIFVIYMLGVIGIKFLRGRYTFFQTGIVDSLFEDVGLVLWPLSLALYIPICIFAYTIKYISYAAEYAEDLGQDIRWKKFEASKQLKIAEQELQTQEFFEDMKQ